ncbi:transposase [Lysobacter sp. M15]|uniref:REP-associated tyrosine transposase n=1 Tax=Lysobacter sp. M15 TaxID=2916837 RepID=UPI0031BAE80A
MRHGRWSQPGQAYLVTTTTRRRRPVFNWFEPAWAACRAMHAFARHGDAVLVAWVLMPDHAHWLLQLGCQESLSGVVTRLKVTTARNANQVSATSGQVWSRGFHDRALRREGDMLIAARYIIANPVRAGLVADVADYPYWNCIYL